MWPKGRDSIRGYPPRNVRIAHIENQLLEIANEKTENIQLMAEKFKIAERHDEVADQHLLAICEGGGSRTREFFIDKFGVADKSLYSLDGEHLQDVVLGLRVKSELPDPTAVLLTVAQNRFLLNSLRGNGFLNMRLTDEESKAVKGVDENWGIKDCIQSQPCLMERTETPGEFGCSTHGTRFLPALLRNSPLWFRIQDGLKLFGVKKENLTAVTAFRLGMVQRSRFTVQLYPRTEKTPGTFGCLLGDAANAIHFWPGRGLNSGIPSAVSLARCLNENWRGRPFREADFTRHEGLMSMLQYRHKSRGWRAMIGTDSHGTPYAIKAKIKEAIIEVEGEQLNNKDSDIDTLMDRLSKIRNSLKGRISPLPNDDALRTILTDLEPATLRTLVVSKSWDTVNVGGEEVDVDLLFEEPELSVLPEPKPSSPKKPAVDKTRILASLIYEGGAKEGHNLPAKLDITDDMKKIKVGRKSDKCDFVLRDTTVSRHHAIITRDEKELIIQDQNSAGGTHINGEQLELDQKQQLQHGDKVMFGQYITYKVELIQAQ
jgi:2-polyprenyl-6-methoxyphenol hydroxylase-like FAD-dependent oxidoreductase